MYTPMYYTGVTTTLYFPLSTAICIVTGSTNVTLQVTQQTLMTVGTAKRGIVATFTKIA